MLFPYDAQLDNIAGSRKWTHSDSCTAADVHAAVGSPLRFRLRFSFLFPQIWLLPFASMHAVYRSYG